MEFSVPSRDEIEAEWKGDMTVDGPPPIVTAALTFVDDATLDQFVTFARSVAYATQLWTSERDLDLDDFTRLAISLNMHVSPEDCRVLFEKTGSQYSRICAFLGRLKAEDKDRQDLNDNLERLSTAATEHPNLFESHGTSHSLFDELDSPDHNAQPAQHEKASPHKFFDRLDSPETHNTQASQELGASPDASQHKFFDCLDSPETHASQRLFASHATSQMLFEPRNLDSPETRNTASRPKDSPKTRDVATSQLATSPASTRVRFHGVEVSVPPSARVDVKPDGSLRLHLQNFTGDICISKMDQVSASMQVLKTKDKSSASIQLKTRQPLKSPRDKWSPLRSPSTVHGSTNLFTAGFASPAPTERKHAPEPTASSSTPNDELPPGWERRFDPRKQRFYYIDHNSRTTTWRHPRGRPALTKPPPPPAAE